MHFSVEEWTNSHERWVELKRVVNEMGQNEWVLPVWDWHLSSHVLVAYEPNQVLGFLRFVTQIIGIEEDHEPLTLDGRELVEAKVLGFGVLPPFRRKGIGLQLQRALVSRSRQLGCFQVRSHSSGDNVANHQLKLRMGFAVHPVVRGDDVRGAYFVKCLIERYS